MKKSDYILKSFINAGGVLAYVSAVAWFFSHVQDIFGQTGNNFIVPVFLLLIFIISASVTGLLVFGRPIMLYLDNLKKEAFIFLFATLGWLVLFVLLIVIALMVG